MRQVNQGLRTKMKMGDDVVIALRKKAAEDPANFSPSKEAEALNVGPNAVVRAVSGATYSHLPGALLTFGPKNRASVGRHGPSDYKKFLAWTMRFKNKWPMKKICAKLNGISRQTVQAWSNMYDPKLWEEHAEMVIKNKPKAAKQLMLEGHLRTAQRSKKEVDFFS